MNDYLRYIRLLVIQMALLLVIACLPTLFYRRYDMVLGLTVGWSASMVYLLMMASRIRRSAKLPLRKAIVSMRMGWVVRLAFLGLVLAVCIHIPAIHLLAAIMGLFSLHIVLYADSVAMVVRQLLVHNIKS